MLTGDGLGWIAYASNAAISGRLEREYDLTPRPTYGKQHGYSREELYVMEIIQPKEHQYPTINDWQRARNRKATNRRNRKQATATRQNRGQRASHSRIGGRWTRTKRAMSSRSWRH